MRVHITSDYYMRILVLSGEGEDLAKMAAKLTAQIGVIHVKINTVNFCKKGYTKCIIPQLWKPIK